MYLYRQTLFPSSIIYHALSGRSSLKELLAGHFVDNNSIHVLYHMEKSFSLYLLEDGCLKFSHKQTIHYPIKNMKVLTLKSLSEKLV